MKRKRSVNLGNFLLSLSDAIDLASPQLVQHQQRVAYISWEMGKNAGLSDDMKETIFVAGLLHDIGAFSYEEKVALRRIEEENTDPHCIRGEVLLERSPWINNTAEIVRHHHRKWQEWDEPINSPLPMASQIIYLADFLERSIDRDKYVLHQDQQLISKILSLSGKYFHPDIIDLLVASTKREEFWLDLMSSRLYSLLLNEGPYRELDIELQQISSLASLFQNIVDFRSRFTATHSAGVAACAEILSTLFGLTEAEVQLMHIAGTLHDLGKLAIPNNILNKPARLTKEEYAIIRSHTYFTYAVLNTIDGFEQITEWAAYHHERLDGSGYPFHCTAKELNIGARIMIVADLITAVTEDRPYRQGMKKEKVINIIKNLTDRQLLDKRITALLIENYNDVSSFVAERQTEALEFYEQQFAFLEDNKS